MKKFKSVMIAALSGVMLFSSCSFFASEVKAADNNSNTVMSPYILTKTRDVFEFSAQEMLEVYAQNSTSDTAAYYIRNRMDVTGKNAVPVRTYDTNGNLKIQDASRDKWSDGKIMSDDASNILGLGAHVNTLGELPKAFWPTPSNEIIWSLAKALNISKDDITLKAESIYQKIDGYNENELVSVITSTAGVTDQNEADVLVYTVKDKQIYLAAYKQEHSDKTDEEIADLFERNYAKPTQMTVRVTLTTKQGYEYKMVVGTDNNFYLINTKAPEEESKFKTTLEYSSEVQGKMDGDTYLPPYYANEEKNAKKDLDATAIIKSTTKEEIVKTNGVDLTADGKANSEGWFYKDVKDKTVIAKVYPFDDYDNTKFNGAVTETVKLTGAQGGEDTQKPSIRWTFRLINRDDKENADGSLTVTLTYNLPVDPDSIPEGWSPIYDEDGKTIHKITITIKKGENYDKDVTVNRNGDKDDKVTTHVKKTWEKLSPSLPQTGAFSAVLVVIVAGAAVFAVTRFRKMHM